MDTTNVIKAKEDPDVNTQVHLVSLMINETTATTTTTTLVSDNFPVTSKDFTSSMTSPIMEETTFTVHQQYRERSSESASNGNKDGELEEEMEEDQEQLSSKMTLNNHVVVGETNEEKEVEEDGPHVIKNEDRGTQMIEHQANELDPGFTTDCLHDHELQSRSPLLNNAGAYESLLQPNSVSSASDDALSAFQSSCDDKSNEDGGEEYYEGGQYSLRYDTFFPTHQTLKSKSMKSSINKLSVSSSLERHQILFDNLDRIFEKDLSESSHDMTICSVHELRDITKMCFAAMSVVFSSLNPSVTIVTNNDDLDDEIPTLSESKDDIQSPGSTHQESNSCTSVSSTEFGVSSNIISRHQSNLTPHTNIPTSPSVASLLSGISDEKLENDHQSNKQSKDSTETQSADDVVPNLFINNMEPTQRPTVPLVVVHMLWKQLIKYRLFDRKSTTIDKQVESIIKYVQKYLIQELGFLDCIEFSPMVPSSDSKEEPGAIQDENSSIQEDIPTISCIQVSHGINLQYGRYLAANCTQLFPFYLNENLKKKLHFPRIYCEETWNAEEALNAAMAKLCLKVFRNHSSRFTDDDGKATLNNQLLLEYSLEMLPWHLMRAMLYRDVLDLLTDHTFVKCRMNVLDFRNAVQMHITDTEEIYNCIDAFIAKNRNVKVDIDLGAILLKSYKLVGGVLHREDPSKWLDEELRETSAREIGDVDVLEVANLVAVSKVLQALGDSLSKHDMKSEAMKFYYKAMLKFESINTFYQKEKVEVGAVQGQSKRHNDSNLMMGGILTRIASIYEWQSRPVDAMLCYERALSYYSRHSSKSHLKGVAKVLSTMGEMHLNFKEYESALSCLQESLALLKAIDENVADEIANLLLLMGHVQREIGNFNEALSFFSESMYDKISVYGKSHPEVGYLHQTIGIVFCDKGQYQKGLSHFEDALRIRESALESVLSHLGSKCNHSDCRIQTREIEVAECMNCIGKVYENTNDLESSFSYYVGAIAIYRSHFLLAVSNQASIMIHDVVNMLDAKSGESSELSILYQHLIEALQIGKQIYSIDVESKEEEDDVDKLMELESQIAEILYDLGLIEGAQYLYRINMDGQQSITHLNETLRSDAKTHFEQSIVVRKRMIKRLKNFDRQEDNNSMEYEKTTIAIISYELGHLFFCQGKCLEENEAKRRNSLSSGNTWKRNVASKECSSAISYFEDARDILDESIEMAEILDYANDENDCWISRLHRTPELYEEMLHTMAVLYRKLERFDKSVECYNKVSILLTRTELREHHPESDPEQSNTSFQKVKVAYSSQSIGDILFDTGEYTRALQSYDEALQLRRSIENDTCVIADTLCLKGNVLLKLKQYDQALLSFDEAFRIRVDKLPQDHKDIAICFHLIGKAYEGDGKLEQALEYYKKAQRILSGHLVDKDIDAADLFFDLGNVVLRQEALSKHFECDEPSEDDVSLALTCLALCRGIYHRNFGANAVEVGNALSLLGLIYKKYEEYETAISTFEGALKIFHGAPLDQSVIIAKTLNYLASTLMLSATEDNEMVLEYLLLAKQTYEEKGSCNCEAYADVMFNLGRAHELVGKMLQPSLQF